ncbi:MAG TPA: hypothetical protein PKU94_04800 [Candidatus Hydrothermia bacterium]|nr:hypothetical protein [Candidatus Hydrothermae bacterium]MDD3648713.1 hypothetical protein [Candidatus Hydrothermia bacterium]MDD5573377.1 hypothetical protein [Candidatus Hydrothermia bacterium]HOK22427.1 hypothetical protein [Candidatus Hydrothermia bacterium]HOL23134.1 hypothetical protein [Candidatus Hydrothermia bacterium]
MPWTLIIMLIIVLVYLVYWFFIEPLLVEKFRLLKKFRFHLDVFVTTVFLCTALVFAGIQFWIVALILSLISASIIVSISFVNTRKVEGEELPVDLKEKDLLLWEGEIVEVRSTGGGIVRAISEDGAWYIPLKLLLQRGFKRVRKVLPNKVVFSLFFPIELYINLTRKLEEFLKTSTNVLVSPPFKIEFVSLAINEVEIKVTFFTEDFRSENLFWDEFFAFLEKEQLSINRLAKYGETQSYGW